MHIIEFSILIASRSDGARKKGELKMKVQPTMLLKTKDGEIDPFCLATIFMKINYLNC